MQRLWPFAARAGERVADRIALAVHIYGAVRADAGGAETAQIDALGEPARRFERGDGVDGRRESGDSILGRRRRRLQVGGRRDPSGPPRDTEPRQKGGPHDEETPNAVTTSILALSLLHDASSTRKTGPHIYHRQAIAEDTSSR